MLDGDRRAILIEPMTTRSRTYKVMEWYAAKVRLMCAMAHGQVRRRKGIPIVGWRPHMNKPSL